MITSRDNEKLKLIRKLAERKHREREGLFAAEGEDQEFPLLEVLDIRIVDRLTGKNLSPQVCAGIAFGMYLKMNRPGGHIMNGGPAGTNRHCPPAVTAVHP